MEILYRVGNRTFEDKGVAEEFQMKYRNSLLSKINQYKHFYLPVAFKFYKSSLEELRDARTSLRIKSYSAVTHLFSAYDKYNERKKALHERIAEYRHTKALIRLLSTTEKQQKNKKTESKK